MINQYTIKILYICLATITGFSSLAAHPVSVSMVENIAEGFIAAINNSDMDISNDTYSIGRITPLKTNGSDVVLGYIVELNPKGFIFCSADNSIEPIIAYSFSNNFNYDDSKSNILLSILKSDLINRNTFYKSNNLSKHLLASANNQKWDNYTVNFNNRSVWGPLLDTSWGQSGHFNNYCPMDTFWPFRSVAGCVAIATAQIANYWQYPQSIFLDQSLDSYSYLNNDNVVNVPGDAGLYDFPSFAEVNNALSNISYSGDHNEEGYLCFAIGVKQEMSYGFQGSGAYSNSTIYRKLGFGSASGSWWNTEVESKVIDNIINAMPVQVSISSTMDFFEGHSVVVDGYNENDGTFHVNTGWGGLMNAWYSFPNVAITYNIIDFAIHDINPNQGWNQWGANELNNKRTPYIMPTEDVVRWTMTCDTEHSFNGLIVGTSGNIITTCNYMSTSSVHSPSVWFVRDDGVLIDEVFINQETEDLSYPAQDSYGNVYFSTDLGNVYRVDQYDHTATLIFSEPNGAQLNKPVKVDSDGYIYIATFYDLYCIDPNGNTNWVYHNPGNSWDDRRLPAIDVNSNHVYHSYYNFDEDRVYVLCLNRLNGSIVATKTFDDITSLFYTASIPSLSNDGTLYIGVGTTLYALNPNNNLSVEWEFTNGIGRIRNAPAIGRDGTLYYSYWENAASLVLASINPANGNENWNIQVATSQDYNVEDIYVDYFNNICFAVNIAGDPDTWQVHCYKDLGSSAQVQWVHDFGYSAGLFAFGPERTMYITPRSGYGHSIIALSDADQSGMGWENNNAPAIPTNPAPADNAIENNTQITLSWDCTDDDGNPLNYSVYLGESTSLMIPIVDNETNNSFTIPIQLLPDSTYIWKVIASDGQATSESPTWSFSLASLKITDAVVGVPTNYYLYQNHPNPFNPITTIRYELPEQSDVQITIYNLLGKEFTTLLSESQDAGFKSIQWDASNVASGVYFCQIRAGEFVQTKKMILLK